MPVPAYPYNRHEQYLNRIATGEGDIPPYPQNREEQYLAAIVENGGGGGGSGGGVLVVNEVDGTLDKSWQEIHDAMLSGIVVMPSISTTEDVYGKYEALYSFGVTCISDVQYEYPEYNTYTISTENANYVCSTADGYPAKE